MLNDFGESRTDLAVTRAIDNTPDFVPSIATIRKHVPTYQAEVTTCPKCIGMEGFEQATMTANGKEYKAVRRCAHD